MRRVGCRFKALLCTRKTRQNIKLRGSVLKFKKLKGSISHFGGVLAGFWQMLNTSEYGLKEA